MFNLNAKVFTIKIVAGLILEIIKIDDNNMCTKMALIGKFIMNLL